MRTKKMVFAMALTALSACVLTLPSFGAEEVARSVILDLKPSAGNPRNSEGDFVRLKDGSILFAYSRFRAAGDGTKRVGAWDAGTCDIAARISTDGGDTWQGRVVLEDDPNGYFCYTAVLECPGELLLGYCVKTARNLDTLRLARLPLAQKH